MESIHRVFLPSFLGYVEFEVARPDPILVVEVARLYHWSGLWCSPSGPKLVTGIPNPRSSSLE